MTTETALQVFRVESGPLVYLVAPELAGRVTEMRYQGHNLLATPAENPTNWGATYWTSPQADWGWPPVPEVDHLPYRVLSSGDSVRLVSRTARILERRFTVEKAFSPAEQEGVVDTFYTIENCGEAAFSMANWEIVRVPAGGLTFFPTGEREITPIAPHGPMATEKAYGTTFYDHERFTGDRCLKLRADGKGGYLAHVLAHLASELLILKVFDDTLPQEQAPGEGECELFANEDGRYVEIEVQGPYRSIPVGQRLQTRVRTVVVPLPESLKRDDWLGLRRFADESRVRFA